MPDGRNYEEWVESILEQVAEDNQTAARLTEGQVEEVQRKVNEVASETGKHFLVVYAELHRKFGVKSYKQIPQDEYDAVLSFIHEFQNQK
jgi:hypothetical protein